MNILVKVELPSLSGLNEDRFTNTFSFMDVPDLQFATLADIGDAIDGFYNLIPTNGLSAMKDLLSPEVDNTALAMRFSFYDVTAHLDGSPHGSPIYTSFHTVQNDAGGNNVGLPAEVAFCITLEGQGRAEAPVEAPDGGDADVALDRPKQRRTGRIYFGPLSTDCLDVVDGIVRPHAQLRDTARLAIDDLVDYAFLNANGSSLAVWSRKDATMYPVTHVSVDNAFDVIRSRGTAPTVRQRDTV